MMRPPALKCRRNDSDLKVYTKLSLELAMPIGLCQLTGDETKVGIVDIQVEQRCWSRSHVGTLELRLWMVEHILCVHSELQRLGLRNLDRFRQARIESPSAGSF